MKDLLKLPKENFLKMPSVLTIIRLKLNGKSLVCREKIVGAATIDYSGWLKSLKKLGAVVK